MADHVKILVVDPNVGALTALRDSLSFAADLEFVGDAGLGPVALTWARTLQPDVVVVAIDEPAARSLSTIDLLARGNPSWTVLALMASFEQEYIGVSPSSTVQAPQVPRSQTSFAPVKFEWLRNASSKVTRGSTCSFSALPLTCSIMGTVPGP